MSAGKGLPKDSSDVPFVFQRKLKRYYMPWFAAGKEQDMLSKTFIQQNFFY